MDRKSQVERLGFFDGLHLGHNVVLKNAIKIAKENNSQSTVITFKEHPLTVLTNEKVEHILTLDERIGMMDKIGIDNLILLDLVMPQMDGFETLARIKEKYDIPVVFMTGDKNIETLEKMIEKTRKSQIEYSKFTQEKVDEIFKHGGDTIVIRGYGFYSEFTEYLDATYTSWGFMKEIHIKIDRIPEEIKKIQIITKEEFNQAFDLMIENMKKDHLKEIS